MQFATNETRSMKNNAHYGRIDLVRKVQKNAMMKSNVDTHYSNAVCKTARGWLVVNNKDTIYDS